MPLLQHVPFEALNERHMEGLAKSLLVQPDDVRLEVADLARGIMLGSMCLFEWPTGMVLVHMRDSRLVLTAFSADPPLAMETCRELGKDLRRLATDWSCDKIETMCFDPRFTRVIKHLGGRVESQTLVLEVADGIE